VVLIAIWIDLPTRPILPIASLNREIKTQLGLDLVGGVQALLEADVPENTDIPQDKMNTAVTIVDNRVNGLGVTEALVQQAGDRRIVVELPGVEDPEEAISTIKETGLLEFVHMASNPLPDGTRVVTDYSPTGELPTSTEGTSPETELLHTVMTGDVLETVEVARDQSGQYVIQFTLTPEGARTFADYTTENAGQYLGIILDKTVISRQVKNRSLREMSSRLLLPRAPMPGCTIRYGSLPIP
jgi:protein-export membrane protein SecD